MVAVVGAALDKKQEVRSTVVVVVVGAALDKKQEVRSTVVAVVAGAALESSSCSAIPAELMVYPWPLSSSAAWRQQRAYANDCPA